MHLLKVIFIFFIFYNLEAQENDSLFLKRCNNIDKSILVRNKFHIIGEYHHQYNNDNVQFTYLKYLHENNIYPKYIFVERGPATAYIYNKYYETGDTSLLDLLFYYKSTKFFYKQVYNYRKTLKDNQKFYIVGIDYESSKEFTHFVIRDMLLKNLKENDTILYKTINNATNFLGSKDYFANLLVEFKIRDNPEIWSNKVLKDDLSQVDDILNYSKDSVRVKKILGSDLNKFKQILKSYMIPLYEKDIYSDKKIRLRDKYMANNIYQTFMLDSTVVLLGQMGSAHISKIYQKDWYVKNLCSVACLLNSDTAFKYLNYKINTNAIIYKTISLRRHKHFELTKADKINFSKMTNCKIYFQKYQQPVVIDNLIFVDNKRPHK